MNLNNKDTIDEKTSEKGVSKGVAEDTIKDNSGKGIAKAIKKIKRNNISILLPFKCLDNKHKVYLFFEILAGICSGFCFPIFNIFFGKTMKSIIEEKDINDFVLIFVIVGVAQFCLSFLSGFLSDLVTQNIVDNLRLRYLDSVLHFDGEFHDNYSGAKLKSDLEFYLTKIKTGISIKFVLTFTYVTSFIILYVWGLFKSFRLVLCISLVFPFMVLVSKICRTYSARYQMKSQIYNNNSLSIAEEAFIGIKTVAGYCGEKFILNKFDLSEKLYSKFTLKTNFFDSLNLGAMKLFTIGSYSLGFWYGTKIIVEQFKNSMANLDPDSFDGATVISVLVGVFVSMYMLNLALPGFQEYLNAVDATHEIFEIINYEPRVVNKQDTGTQLDTVKQIKFRDVKFRYSKRNDVDVFQGLDFELEEGKVYAFVGESGCGKSTILKLIERLYEPTEGEIVINENHNLKDLNLKWWRSQIGIVSQDPHLFSSSIAKNIKYSLISKYELDAINEGRTIDGYVEGKGDTNSMQDNNIIMKINDKVVNNDVSKDENNAQIEKDRKQKKGQNTNSINRVNLDFISNSEIRSIGKKICIHDFVNTLPNKYDTLVGAAVSSLSGGQKQRISIGRAIIRKPQILILDEATSSLDNRSEHMVQKTINRLKGSESRITILVAHRLNTIRHADKIFVLSNKHKSGSANLGSYIAEQGTHEELMRNKEGLYWTMVKNQKVTEETDNNTHALSRAETIASSSVLANSYGGSNIIYRGSSTIIDEFSESKKKSKCIKCSPFSFMRKLKSLFSRDKTYSYIYKQIFQNKWKSGAALFFTLLTSVVYPFFGLIFAKYVKALFDIQNAEENSKKYSIFMVFISVTMFFGEWFQHYFKCLIGENVESTTKHNFFENVLHQEISFFEEKTQSPGYLLSYINRDIHLLKVGFINNIGIIIQFVGLFITSGVLAFYFCPIVAFLLTFVYVIFTGLISKRSVFQQKKVGNANKGDEKMEQFVFTSDEDMEKDADFLIQEAFLNIDVIISYGLENYYIHLISKSLQNSYNAQKRQLIVKSAMWGLSQSIQLFSHAFMYYIGSILTRNYGVEVENFLKAVFVFLFTGSYAGTTMADKGNSTEALETFNTYYPLMIRKSQIDPRDESGIKIDKHNVIGKVEVRDVNFRYPSRPTVSVYNNLTFTCEEKKTTAIVGETGCGKSTIMSLLLKYYELRNEHVMLERPHTAEKKNKNIKKKRNEESTETDDSDSHESTNEENYLMCRNKGEILIDGININDYNLRDLRKMFSIVTQEPMLFNMSIYENITFGTEGATLEDVKRASKIAAVDNFIESLPEKYDTNVGPFGKNLSGGQKQRIALARAVLRDPKILLLDEATSSLDANSEKLIEEAFENIKSKKDKTIITIAHRISSIKKSDKIVVFNRPNSKGSVVQTQGTHNELMQQKDCIYRKYVNLTL